MRQLADSLHFAFRSRGKAIKVKVNAYKVVPPKNLTAYHYDVRPLAPSPPPAC